MRAPVLVFGYGNPSRGDDAVGPEFARRLEVARGHEVEAGALEVLTDFQLQVEHALDVRGRQRVYFVDATAEGEAPGFEVRPVRPVRDATFSTHLLSPAAVLHTCQEVLGEPPPEAFLIAIRGERFELGAPMSPEAERNLSAALAAFPA